MIRKKFHKFVYWLLWLRYRFSDVYKPSQSKDSAKDKSETMTKQKRSLIALLVVLTSPIWIVLMFIVGPFWLLGRIVYDVLGQEPVQNQ